MAEIENEEENQIQRNENASIGTNNPRFVLEYQALRTTCEGHNNSLNGEHGSAESSPGVNSSEKPTGICNMAADVTEERNSETSTCSCNCHDNNDNVTNNITEVGSSAGIGETSSAVRESPSAVDEQTFMTNGEPFTVIAIHRDNNASQKSLPSYKSLIGDILHDEPPKYEDVTGKKIVELGHVENGESGSRSRVNENPNIKKKITGFIILMAIILVAALLIYLSVTSRVAEDHPSQSSEPRKTNFVGSPK